MQPPGLNIFHHSPTRRMRAHAAVIALARRPPRSTSCGLEPTVSRRMTDHEEGKTGNRRARPNRRSQLCRLGGDRVRQLPGRDPGVAPDEPRAMLSDNVGATEV
jgi:hypothetical protein